jgi:GTP-binding protein
MLKIDHSEFQVSVADPRKLPEPALPEICFIGRSNVGKSSLINLVLGRRDLAKSSSKPGKTRLINYFLVNGDFHLVDLPGYGFAKTSADMRNDWARTIEGYLTSPRRRLVVQLVDVRHGLSRLDTESIQWLMYHMLQVVVVLTKCDKLGREALAAETAAIRATLKPYPVLQVLASSTRTRQGRDELLGFMGHWLANKG